MKKEKEKMRKFPCPKCNFKNEARSKYCNQCATGLPQVSRPVTEEARPGTQSEHKDIAHPITQSFREYLQKRVLDDYEQEKKKGPGSAPIEESVD